MTDLKDPEHSMLALMLDAALPFRIHDYAAKGGPDRWDYERLRRGQEEGKFAVLDVYAQPIPGYADVLGERADTLLYGGKKGEAAALFAVLADALAVMSFCPGGVKFAGRCWRAEAGWPYWCCADCRGEGRPGGCEACGREGTP